LVGNAAYGTSKPSVKYLGD